MRAEGAAPPPPDAGFSLVEVIVALVLLAMVALLSVPFFAWSLDQTASTSSRTSAIAQVQALLDQAHADPTCGGLAGLGRSTGADAQGRSFTVTVDLQPTSVSCRTALLVTVTATAVRDADNVRLATAATQVYVP